MYKEKNSYEDLDYFEMYDEYKRLQAEIKNAADQKTKEFLMPYYIKAEELLLKLSIQKADEILKAK